MANTTFYKRGDAYHDSAGNPAIIEKGNQLTFTEHFNAGGGGGGTPYTPPAYSTEEHLTGRKWVDGKDIYEVTLDIGALPNKTTKIVVLPTFENVISLWGIVKSSTGVLPIPYSAIDPNYSVQLGIADASLKIQTGSDRSSYVGNVTIQYTKPTPTRTTAKKTVKKG